MHSQCRQKEGRKRAERVQKEGRRRAEGEQKKEKRMGCTEKHLQVTCSSIDMAITMMMMTMMMALALNIIGLVANCFMNPYPSPPPAGNKGSQVVSKPLRNPTWTSCSSQPRNCNSNSACSWNRSGNRSWSWSARLVRHFGHTSCLGRRFILLKVLRKLQMQTVRRASGRGGREGALWGILCIYLYTVNKTRPHI